MSALPESETTPDGADEQPDVIHVPAEEGFVKSGVGSRRRFIFTSIAAAMVMAETMSAYGQESAKQSSLARMRQEAEARRSGKPTSKDSGISGEKVDAQNVSSSKTEAEIVIPEGTHPLAAELMKKGYLIVDPYPKNEAERVIQGKNMITPKGYKCVPVKIRATVNAIQGYPGRPGTHILLPCFMDVMDTTEVACAVTVYHGNKKIPHKAKIVYSQPTKDGPRSPILSLTEIEANSAIVVEALHWVNVPVYTEYPGMTQDAIKTQLGNSATSIYAALDTRNNKVRYSTKNSGFDIGNLNRLFKEGGDCTQLAAYLSSLDPNHLAIIEGFAQDGPHAMCMGKVGNDENALLLEVDPRGGSQNYVGPSRNWPNNFLTVNAGGVVTISDRDIQSWKGGSKDKIGEEVELKGSLRGINRGLFYRARSFEKATASYMDLVPPADVQAYAMARAQMNHSKYLDPSQRVAGEFTGPVTQASPR